MIIKEKISVMISVDRRLNSYKGPKMNANGSIFRTGLYWNVNSYPGKHLGTSYAEDVVMGYLESDTISDVPFRRVVNRYPENFKIVIDYYAEQDGFTAGGIEDLMQTFKPESYDKLPGIIVVMDQEIVDARLKR